MSLTDKLQKSVANSEDAGYEIYRGLAHDPNPEMFVSKEEKLMSSLKNLKAICKKN